MGADLLELTEGAPERRIDTGEAVVREGEEPADLYVLVSGRVVVRRGDEDYIAIEMPGACIGEMALLIGRTHTASVVASEPSVVRVVPDARDALRADPALLHAVASLLARRLELVNGYLSDLRQQYGGVDGGLGMVDTVLRGLVAHPGDDLEPGSEREPDPLY